MSSVHLALAASLLLGASGSASSSPRWLTAVSSFVKVRPGMDLPRSDEVSLLAARGGCEGFQVATTLPARAVRPESLSLHQGKTEIPVRLFREGFVPVTIPTGPSSRGGDAKGLWPDPLIPEVDPFVHERRNAFPHDATAARPVVIFGRVCVPRSAPPGRYRGALKIRAKNRPTSRIRVGLEVEPFAIPATSSLPTSFGLSLYTVAKGHGLDPSTKAAHALLDRYAKALLAHRITAGGMTMDPLPTHRKNGRLRVDFRAYDQEMGPFFEGTALPSGARFTTAQLIEDHRLSRADRITYDRAVRDHFRARHWPIWLFFYAKDEPTPKDYPKVLAQASRIHAAGGISVLVTAPLTAQLGSSTDIFCPLINCFFPRPGPATCPTVLGAAQLRKRIPSWAHVWWYQSCMSHGCNGPIADPRIAKVYRGWASYTIDTSVPRNRAMGPLAFLEGVDGELYWDTAYEEQKGDPWSGSYAYGGNGDGTLLYPGTPAHIGGKTGVPVGSLRLEAIRDGLEDYEWLRLARKLGLEKLADASVRKLARSGYQITEDPAIWERVRAHLAQGISAAWRDRPLPAHASGR